MDIRLRINVDPSVLDTWLGAGALVSIERSATGGGGGLPAPAGGFSVIWTAPIVANQMVVTYYDTTGTAASWYRTQYTDSLGAHPSEYSPEFQPDIVSAYASVADFTSTMESAPPGARVTRIEEVLEEASRLIEGAIGWDFYRHPATGVSEVRLYDGPRNGHRLCVHEGIVSLATVAVRDSAATATWTSVAAADYFTEPRVLLPDESYTHLALTGVGTQSFFWPGIATVQLTGVFGYQVIPTRIRRATVALARQIYRADATTPGGMAGEAELSMGMLPRGWPDDTWRAIRYYRDRDMCWV